MMCPECGSAHTHVVETRREDDGLMLRRRHECDQQHRFNSFQLHEVTLRSAGWRQIRERLSAVSHGIALRTVAWSRRTMALRDRSRGLSSGQIAAKLNITSARVRQIWKENP